MTHVIFLSAGFLQAVRDELRAASRTLNHTKHTYYEALCDDRKALQQQVQNPTFCSRCREFAELPCHLSVARVLRDIARVIQGEVALRAVVIGFTC